MIIDDYLKSDKVYKNYRFNLSQIRKYWLGSLVEKCLSIFKWRGLPPSLPQKEIEMCCIMRGYTGIIQNDDKLYATQGSMYGVTAYPDVFTSYTFTTPTFSGHRTINKNCVIVDNNYSRMPTILLINRYANLLAHNDLSYQCALINSRAQSVIAASDDKVAASVTEWYNKLLKGETVAILDNVGMETLLNATGLNIMQYQHLSSTAIKDYFDSSQNLLRSFYNDIGLPMSREKSDRLVTAETTQDNPRILFNVSDMLKMRKKACKLVSKIFGEEWTVELSEEYKQGDNNGTTNVNSKNAETRERDNSGDN